jgi:penicillin-binding protein 1A
MNYKGEWKGPVLARVALATSMNVPSLKVLDMIGFDSAIETASALLGIHEPNQIARLFPRKYPLGLGIAGVAPIQMARAFATIGNLGREVVPIGVRYIEDRNGKIILEPEKELRNEQKKKGKAIQIISPQAAFIMTNILKSTVEFGTLNYAKNTVGGFTMPMAGKTGTTQNWSDIWTVGFSPYYATAIWFGFDQPGNSLGVTQTGATAPAPVWAKFMKDIHTNLAPKDFPRPEGIVEMNVTARTGLIPPPNYAGKIIKEFFIAGTEPKRFDDFQEFEIERDKQSLDRLRNAILPQELSVDRDFATAGLYIDSNLLSIDPRVLNDSSVKDDRKSNPLLD